MQHAARNRNKRKPECLHKKSKQKCREKNCKLYHNKTFIIIQHIFETPDEDKNKNWNWKQKKNAK